jgi:hypothetical protein
VADLSELINEKSLRAYSCGDSSGIAPDSHFNSQKRETQFLQIYGIFRKKKRF